MQLLEERQAGLVDSSHHGELIKLQRIADDLHRQNTELSRQLATKTTESTRLTDSVNTTQVRLPYLQHCQSNEIPIGQSIQILRFTDYMEIVLP